MDTKQIKKIIAGILMITLLLGRAGSLSYVFADDPTPTSDPTPAPAQPVAPVAPVAPVQPVTPVNPVVPTVAPVAPVAPVQPVGVTVTPTPTPGANNTDNVTPTGPVGDGTGG